MEREDDEIDEKEESEGMDLLGNQHNTEYFPLLI